MATHRVYIDESGDHKYRQVYASGDRFLALTAAVIEKGIYQSSAQPQLENLKKDHFRYDPDDPVVLTRSMIVKRKRWFGVLADRERRGAWCEAVLEYFRNLDAQIFTVVIDKRSHKETYPDDTYDPYEYSLEVLLNRIRGWLNVNGATADIVAEARGRREDMQIKQAYAEARRSGTRFANASQIEAAFPDPNLRTVRKSENIAGLQIADLLCYGQKQQILSDHELLDGGISGFTARLNGAIAARVNSYGRYLLR